LSIAIVVLPLTYLSVVFGELIPKTLALRNPAQVALFGVRFVRIIDSIFSPIIGLFEASTTIFLRILSRGRDTQSRPEENAVEITHFTPAHREIILNMAAIEKRLIRDFFVPWERVVHVDFNDPIEKVIELIFSSSHTRYPVTQGPIVAGIINAKEVLAARESGITDWLRCLRPATSVQSQDTALHALRLLQEKRSHLAIVDKRAGIVTLEDINEEIFGEIYDEHEDGRVKKLIASTIKTRGPASEPR
jgi:putative hemolysin